VEYESAESSGEALGVVVAFGVKLLNVGGVLVAFVANAS